MAISCPYPRPRYTRRAFTLLELLTVMAVVGVLAGVLVPVLGAVKRHTNKARNQVLFAKIGNAIEEYKNTYGSYPIFDEMEATDSGDDRIFMLNAGNNFLLRVLSLTGADDDPARALNRRGIRFLDLPDYNLSTYTPIGTNDNPTIIDSFGSPQIAVIINLSKKRAIGRDAFMLPVAASDGTKPLIPVMMKEFLPQSIAMYSIIENKQDDSGQSEFSTNWPYQDYNRP